MKKRNITLALCAVTAAVMMTACSNSGNNNESTVTTPTTTATTASTEAESTTEEAETATEEAETATETTEAGGTETGASVDLDQLLEDIQAGYGDDYTPSMDYSVDELENTFGLAPELYDESIAQGPMISINIDTFIAIKAVSGKGEEVEKILSDYRQDQIDNSLQYPMNLPKLYSSEVVRHGDYVFFVMLGTPTEESLDLGQDEALESAKESNQIALDIIEETFGA